MVQQTPPHLSSSRMDSGQTPMKEPWAVLTNEPSLRRMQPFEEKCNGRLSLLASKVLADSRGIVWMYVLRESVSCYYPEYSGIDPGLPGVPQEAHSEEASVKENVREAEGDNTSAALYQQQWQLILFVALLFLFFLGRWVDMPNSGGILRLGGMSHAQCSWVNPQKQTSHLDRWRRVPNHKDLYIDAQPLDAFQPGMRNALEKLQWASTHATTVPEDIMDSLSCIFGV
ncbi:hypothetical protein BD769DRAFT_1397420 [Suillus cothurnatus]|nr:hypothetical protein BD769DRAFT_1397420 [Suillus cothurnatus]